MGIPLSESAALLTGITPDLVTTRLASVLHRLNDSRIHTPIRIDDAPRQRYRWMLDNGLLDLALLPGMMTAAADQAERLWDEAIHLAVPAAHPLAAHVEIDIRHLARIPLILDGGEAPATVGKTVLSTAQAAGLAVTVVCEATHLETRLMLVAAGFGATALPARSLALTATPGIVGRPLSPPVRMSIVAVRPRSGLPPAAERLLTIVRSCTGTDPGEEPAGT